MQLCAIAKAANNGIDVADTVMAIPGWYTDSMRNAMMVRKRTVQWRCGGGGDVSGFVDGSCDGDGCSGNVAVR